MVRGTKQRPVTSGRRHTHENMRKYNMMEGRGTRSSVIRNNKISRAETTRPSRGYCERQAVKKKRKRVRPKDYSSMKGSAKVS